MYQKNIQQLLNSITSGKRTPYEFLKALEIESDITSVTDYIHYCIALIQDLEQQQNKTIEIICVESSRQIDIACLIYACAILGIGLFPVNPQLPDSIKQYLIDASKAELLLSSETATYSQINTSTFHSFPYSTSVESSRLNRPYKNNIKLLLSSSGTSQKPRLIQLQQENIFAHISSLLKKIRLGEEHSWLNCLPLYHVAGAMIIFRCMASNAGMILSNNFNAKNIWEIICRKKISHISLVPAMLDKLLDISMDTPPPQTLEVVLVGGDFINSQLYQRAINAGWPVVISYGMTEACSTIAVGNSLKKLELLNDIEVRKSQHETLEFRGPMFNQPHNAWFDSCDFGDIDSPYIFIKGRDSQRIISGGKTWSAEFIEGLFEDCPFVNDIAIAGLKNATWGESIVALVKNNAEKIETWGKQHIDKQMRPRQYIECSEIPRNSLGKIQRDQVKLIINAYGKSLDN